MDIEVDGEIFNVRGLTGEEVEKLNQHGYERMYYERPEDEDTKAFSAGVEKAVNMVLSQEDIGRLNKIPGVSRAYSKVWMAIIRETYAEEETAEKN